MIMVNLAALITAILLLMQGIQSPLPDFFIKSWKKGKTQIEERQCEIYVSKAKPSLKFTIRNISGKTKYRLSVNPYEANGSIKWWTVSLLPSSRLLCFFSTAECVNLLKPSNDPHQDAFSQSDSIYWFHPQCGIDVPGIGILYNCPPIMQKRIVQVESFYVILQLMEFETDINNPEEAVSMTLRIQFLNSYDPHSM
jgi:hypothetical protein